MIITDRDLLDLLAVRVEFLNYANFKYSVDEPALHELYAGFWLAHWQYQRE